MEAYDILELKANQFMEIISKPKYFKEINEYLEKIDVYLGETLLLQNAELKENIFFHNAEIAPVKEIETHSKIKLILLLIYRNKIGYLFL